MMITQKLWDKYSYLRQKNIAYRCNSEYLNDVLSRILKKEVHQINLDYIFDDELFENGKYIIEDKDSKKVQDYIFGDFIKDHNLIPSKSILVSFDQNQDSIISSSSRKYYGNFYIGSTVSEHVAKGVLEKIPYLFFGDDLLISFKVYLSPDNHIYSIPTFLFYTGDSIDASEKIIKDLLNILIPLRVEKIEENDKSYTIDLLMVDDTGEIDFEEKIIKIEDNVSLSSLYPEDLDEKELLKFLKSSDSGIVILYGVPGGGKSTFLKHLIKDNPDLHFSYLIDSGFIGRLDSLKKWLITEEEVGGIYIMEDCEKLLESRDISGGSSWISDLLNLSDGILGDLLSCKFILTFNSGKNVDPAILRKGRTRFMQEFRPVTGERLLELAKYAGIDDIISEDDKNRGLTVAEIFNYKSENYGKKKTKIGF